MLTAFTDYKSAFFEGLKISYIRPLAVADYNMFVGNETSMLRLENIMFYLPKIPRSVIKDKSRKMHCMASSSFPVIECVLDCLTCRLTFSYYTGFHTAVISHDVHMFFLSISKDKYRMDCGKTACDKKRGGHLRLR